jgi:hypothetical protein
MRKTRPHQVAGNGLVGGRTKAANVAARDRARRAGQELSTFAGPGPNRRIFVCLKETASASGGKLRPSNMCLRAILEDTGLISFGIAGCSRATEQARQPRVDRGLREYRSDEQGKSGRRSSSLDRLEIHQAERRAVEGIDREGAEARRCKAGFGKSGRIRKHTDGRRRWRLTSR